MKGLFIVFEGCEGSGKTSAIAAVVEALADKDINFIYTREPGGTVISNKIREIILDPSTPEMEPETEALLYAASRTQHTKERILPALEQGKVVLCDRYIDSSFAYQGYGRDLGFSEVAKINDFGIKGFRPDMVIFFDIKPKDAFERIGDRKFDRLEKENIEFHNKIYSFFWKQSIKENTNYVTIDATESKEEVANKVIDIIMKKIESTM